ncbi:hypothetical protein ACIBQ5_16415 [Streptomyces massasporeus]|uniref:hypothetical protein n=1 Tax=Streptomyces massasporeus TaxID=67324 RepID=UPI0037A8C73F
MSKPRQRMGLYRTVLHEGLRDDLPRYLNQDQTCSSSCGMCCAPWSARYSHI